MAKFPARLITEISGTEPAHPFIWTHQKRQGEISETGPSPVCNRPVKRPLTETNSDIFKKNSYLAARLGGIKQKESSRGSVMNNTFLLFHSPRPRSQVIYLIYRKCRLYSLLFNGKNQRTRYKTNLGAVYMIRQAGLPNSGAPQLRNCGNLPTRENLVITWRYTERATVRPHHRHTNVK